GLEADRRARVGGRDREDRSPRAGGEHVCGLLAGRPAPGHAGVQQRAAGVGHRRLEAGVPLPGRQREVRLQCRQPAAGRHGRLRKVRVLDGRDGTQLLVLETPDRSLGLYHLAFSPNGRYLAAGTAEQSAVVWDLAAVRRGLADLDLGWEYDIPPAVEG